MKKRNLLGSGKPYREFLHADDLVKPVAALAIGNPAMMSRAFSMLVLELI